MATITPRMTAPAHDTLQERKALVESNPCETRARGLFRAAEHNLDLHVAAQIREHGGYQDPLPL